MQHVDDEPVERSDLLDRLMKAVSPTNEPGDAARRPAATREVGTLLILPCSKRKTPPISPVFPRSTGRNFVGTLVETAEQVQRGRDGLKSHIDWASNQYVAADYYAGWLYSAVGFRRALCTALESSQIEAVILSGAYGAVFADELIHSYDKKLDAGYWLRYGLDRALEEYVGRSRIRRVCAFAAATSPYAKVLRGIAWGRFRERSTLTEAGLFSVDFQGNGGAQRVVPAALGEAVTEFIRAGLEKESILHRMWSGQRLHYDTLC